MRQALGSRAYDAEEVATHDRDIIQDGRVQGCFLVVFGAQARHADHGECRWVFNLLLADSDAVLKNCCGRWKPQADGHGTDRAWPEHDYGR
ncbi:MAG: hypothetical protein R3E89_06500 [Thiolinea sp.]